MASVPGVLFVCVHNAGRSQMAAAFLREYGGNRVAVRSAGSAPAETVNPAVVDVMRERGIDLTGEVPKKLTESVVRDSDVVITMGCGDACPVLPGTRYVDWALDDPAGRGADDIRPIRDDIERRVRALIDELIPA
jgi:arsenate reductase